VNESFTNLAVLSRFLEDTAFILPSRCLLLLESEPVTQAAEHPAMTALREKLKPVMTLKDGIAHIPVQGILAYNPDPIEMAFCGMEDSRNVLSMVNQAVNNKDVHGIKLDVDSPGGMMTGGFEIADAVQSASKVKPTIAHIGGAGASLAYLIASQAGEVVANRTARVGSIGAFVVFTDTSAAADRAGVKVKVFKNKEATFKAAGYPGTSLTGDQENFITAETQANFDEFAGMISKGRPQIPKTAMRGQVFTGKEALSNGLIDRIGDAAFATSLVKHAVRITNS
jgi:signal peptide peptidase SppA